MNDTGSTEESRRSGAFVLRIGAPSWRMVGALISGTLLMAVLSIPAVLVPGTRTGATVAAALIAGALVAKRRRVLPRAGIGAAMGAVLALIVSAAAWVLLSDAPDAAVWQVVIRSIVTHSMIVPLDDVVAPWLGGFEQLGERLLIARFTASNLVLGLAGGLLGGLLASGAAPGPDDTPDTEGDGDEQPQDGVEDVEKSEDGSHDALAPQDEDVEKQPPDDTPPSEAEEEPQQAVAETSQNQQIRNPQIRRQEEG